MKIDTFLLERSQTLYENEVEINLTESGVHHATMADLVPPDEMDAIRDLPLPDQPKEGAPPFQASTLDAQLSVATDDEADAIRSAARRANIEVPS